MRFLPAPESTRNSCCNPFGQQTMAIAAKHLNALSNSGCPKYFCFNAPFTTLLPFPTAEPPCFVSPLHALRQVSTTTLPLVSASRWGAARLHTLLEPTTELAAIEPANSFAAPAWTVADPAGVFFSNDLGLDPLYKLFLSWRYGHLSTFTHELKAKYVQGSLALSSFESCFLESDFLPFPAPLEGPGAAFTEAELSVGWSFLGLSGFSLSFLVWGFSSFDFLSSFSLDAFAFLSGLPGFAGTCFPLVVCKAFSTNVVFSSCWASSIVSSIFCINHFAVRLLEVSLAERNLSIASAINGWCLTFSYNMDRNADSWGISLCSNAPMMYNIFCRKSSKLFTSFPWSFKLRRWCWLRLAPRSLSRLYLFRMNHSNARPEGCFPTLWHCSCKAWKSKLNFEPLAFSKSLCPRVLSNNG